LRQTLADLLQRLARVTGGRDIDHGAVSGAGEKLKVPSGVVEPDVVRGGHLHCRLLAANAPWHQLGDAEISDTTTEKQAEERGG